MSHPSSGNSLFSLNAILKDEDFRSFKLAMCDDMDVVNFWEKTNLNGYTYYENEVEISSLAFYMFSKLNPFLSNSIVSNVVSQPKTVIDFNKIKQGDLSLIVRLPKNQLDSESLKIFKHLFLAYLDLELFKPETEEIENKPVVIITDFDNFLINDTLDMISKYSQKVRFICTVNNTENLKTETKDLYKSLLNVFSNVIQFKNLENPNTLNLKNNQALCDLNVDSEQIDSILYSPHSKFRICFEL